MRIIAFLTLLIFGLSVHAQDINAAIEEFNLGNQAVQASNPTLAIEKYQAAMGIASTLGDEGQEIVAAAKKQIPTLYYQLGVQDYKDKNNDKAIAEFQNAIKFGEEYGDTETVEKSKEIIPKLYFTKGNDLFKEDKFDEALTNFKMAAELDPNYSRPYWGMALAYQKQGKFAEMDEAFRKSRELAIAEKDDALVDRINTTGKRFLQSEATANLKAQKWNDAIKNLNLSNEYKADDPDTYYYLAVSYNATRNWVEAVNAAENGININLDPNNFIIEYEVESNPAGFTVSYFNETGGTEQVDVNSTTWKKKLGSITEGSQFVLIQAQAKNENANISVKINFQNRVFKSANSSGDYVIAATDGNIVIEEDNLAKFYFEMGNAYKGAANNEKACEAYNNAKFGKFVENANYEITQVLKCK